MTKTLTPLEIAIHNAMVDSVRMEDDSKQAWDNAVQAIAKAVSALSAEPAAWLNIESNVATTSKSWAAKWKNDSGQVQPLFPSPPDQSARIAELEKACEAKDKSISNLQSVVAHRGRQIDKLQRSEPHRTADVRRELSAEIADLRARLAKAVELMKPFADAAKAFSPVISDDDWCPIDFVCGKDMAEITVQVLSFRAAAQFVKEGGDV